MRDVPYSTLILLVLVIAAFFVPLPFAPLFDLDEGAFSEATREMLVGKDYITTYLNGELRFDKPILIYWFQLVSVKLFGLNEFALRLPSALAGTLWALVIYIFTKDHFGRNQAFFAVLFMVAALQVNMIAKAAIADALLNLFVALSMFHIYRFYEAREKRYLYFAFLFIGLGALTKGPVAILIPLAVSFLFFAYKRELKVWVRGVFNPLGILIFAAVALPWYVAEYMAQGQAFIDGFFFKHNVGRFGNSMEGHSGSLVYYIPVLIVGMMPFSYFALKALGSVKRFFREDLHLFLFLWFAFVFVFFSLSGTKLPHYVIYGYTPLFILSAVRLTESFKKAWLLVPLILLLTVLLFLPDIALALQGSIKDKLAVVLIEQAMDVFDLQYRLLLLCIIILTTVPFLVRIAKEYLLILVAFVMVVTVNYIVIPTYGKLVQLPVKEAALLAKDRGYQGIIMHKINMPSFNVYYEGLVSRGATPGPGDIVFTKITKLHEFASYRTLYRKNGFILLKVEK